MNIIKQTLLKCLQIKKLIFSLSKKRMRKSFKISKFFAIHPIEIRV